MAEMISGTVSGICVGFFGIWAFLKGIESMMVIYMGGKPRIFKSKVIGKTTESNTGTGLENQIKALFAEPEKRGD